MVILRIIERIIDYFSTFVLHPEYYGNDGPIHINTSIVPVLDLWFEAGRELGYDIGDPNGFQRQGNTLIQKKDYFGSSNVQMFFTLQRY